MGTTFKKGKNWYIDFYDKGKRHRKKVGPSRGVARIALKDVEVRIAKGEWLGIVEEKKVRFKEYASKWLEEREIRLRRSTQVEWRSAFSKYLLPRLGDLYIAQIKEENIEEFVSSLPHLSNKRINNILVPLKILFKTATRRKEIKENPCQYIKPLKVGKAQIDLLTFEEVRRFLKKVDPHYHAYFFTAFFTGMRPNELIALRWEDIDFSGKKTAVRRGRVRGVEGPPKTHSSYRDVEILSPLFEVLKKHEVETRLKFRSPYVFLSRVEGLIHLDNLRKRHWYPTLERARLRPRRMYETRHTFATLMLGSGENPHWVARMMGHSSTDMLFEHYSRWIPNLTHRDGSAFLSQWEKSFSNGHRMDTKDPKRQKEGVEEISNPLKSHGGEGRV
jgi:integrase